MNKLFILTIGFFLFLGNISAQTETKVFTKADTAIAQIYYQFEAADYDGTLQLIREAKINYPERKSDLVIYEVNCYLSKADYPKALKAINETIVFYKDSTHILKLLYFNKGVIYASYSSSYTTKTEQDRYNDSALVYYTKTKDLDDKYDMAYNGIANYYITRGNEYLKEADEVPLNNETLYKQLKNKGLDEFNIAISYLERAMEINPNETYKKILGQLYLKTGQLDKKKYLDQH